MNFVLKCALLASIIGISACSSIGSVQPSSDSASALSQKYKLAGKSKSPLSVKKQVMPTTPQGKVDNVISYAKEMIGTPYVWGGNTPKEGFDCSGLMVYVFEKGAGIELPRVSRDMSKMRVQSVSRDKLRAGDLLFFKTDRRRKRVNHVALYVGGGRFIHAPTSGKLVKRDTLSKRYWTRAYVGAKRVIPAPNAPIKSKSSLHVATSD